ncbi:MAG TPA: ABC transporter substrate-binding protein [Acidimicrobiia bacterium]|nr:ABC transporter substrate-binding protein [Acidimicrobiia bacterium]
MSATTGATEIVVEVSDGSDSYPRTVSAANGEVMIGSRPERIISMSPTATEILFAIGAGDQVVAVDEFSTYPADVPTTRLSGFEPNVEAMAAFDPDLVVLSTDVGDAAAGLNLLGVAVMLQPPALTLADTYLQIGELGAATGHAAEALTIVSDMRRDITDMIAGIPALAGRVSYYHELDSALFSVTSSTFIGEVYGLFGLVNIADGAAVGGVAYPQLSGEYIIVSDPDLIFLGDATCCGESAESIAARPGWEGLKAVLTGSVIELDSDIVSRWGPRILDFVRVVGGAVTSLVGNHG